ncbi:hypothetical protein HN51_018997 [Arachis hypogaea]
MAAECNGVPIGCFNLVICLSKRNSRTIASHQEKVQQPLDYITENGIDEYNDPTLSLEEALLDTFRVHFNINGMSSKFTPKDRDMKLQRVSLYWVGISKSVPIRDCNAQVNNSLRNSLRSIRIMYLKSKSEKDSDNSYMNMIQIMFFMDRRHVFKECSLARHNFKSNMRP